LCGGEGKVGEGGRWLGVSVVVVDEFVGVIVGVVEFVDVDGGVIVEVVVDEVVVVVEGVVEVAVVEVVVGFEGVVGVVVVVVGLCLLVKSFGGGDGVGEQLGGVGGVRGVVACRTTLLTGIR
jgi:hypothetical protein